MTKVHHGSERHAEYDFAGDLAAGELYAHLTDDHDLSTSNVATWPLDEREYRHARLHGKSAVPAPASPS